MKQAMMWAIMAMIAIILMASFGFHLGGAPDVVTVPGNISGTELYVCPVASNAWDSISVAMRPFTRGLVIIYSFVVMVLVALWGWAMYQNLLKDKFDSKSFVNAWKFTKLTFWAGLILLILVKTPNYYRTVHLAGDGTAVVLCENNTPNALAVPASSVLP